MYLEWNENSIFINGTKSTIIELFRVFSVVIPYDLIKPGIPSFEPPKYRTTYIETLIRFLLFKLFKMGSPALPLGSPESVENSSILLLFKIRYA